MYDEVMPNDQFITVAEMTKFIERIYSTLLHLQYAGSNSWFIPIK